MKQRRIYRWACDVDGVLNGSLCWLDASQDVRGCSAALRKPRHPAIDKHAMTPLCMAAQYGHKDIAKLLLAHGANPNDGSLTYAAGADQREMAQLLISRGARPTGDPMAQAAIDGRVEMLRLLIEKGADVNVKGVHAYSGEPGRTSPDIYGSTPLFLASCYGQPEAVKILLDSKADPNRKSIDGYPLMAAARNGYKSIVECCCRLAQILMPKTVMARPPWKRRRGTATMT